MAHDRERPPAAVEGLVLVVAVLVFGRVHAAVGRDATVATANALHLQAIEQALHLDVEAAANRWLAARPGPAVAAALVYRLYYVAVASVLVWTWVRHPDAYVRARRVLLVLAAVALLVYWAFPVSPPRFAQPGIVDVVAQHDLLGSRSRGETGTGIYSAMPSLHVGWAAWCAYATWTALRPTRPRLARAAWAFPLVMALVVLGTGNHYVLDVAGAGLLLAVGVLATGAHRRTRTIRA